MSELMHYGVLGMKWGVRRTPEQLGHKPKTKKKMTADERVKQQRRKDVQQRRTMSDQELKKKIERIKMEQQLVELTEKDLHPGRAFAKQVLNSSGSSVAKTVVTGSSLYTIKKTLTGEPFNAKEFAGYAAPKPKKK